MNLEQLVALSGIGLFGLYLMILGGRIVLSDKYFTHWQNTVWKESGDKQWQPSAVNYNRYGTALGSAIAGVALVVISLHAFFKILAG